MLGVEIYFSSFSDSFEFAAVKCIIMLEELQVWKYSKIYYKAAMNIVTKTINFSVQNLSFLTFTLTKAINYPIQN